MIEYLTSATLHHCWLSKPLLSILFHSLNPVVFWTPCHPFPLLLLTIVPLFCTWCICNKHSPNRLALITSISPPSCRWYFQLDNLFFPSHPGKAVCFYSSPPTVSSSPSTYSSLHIIWFPFSPSHEMSLGTGHPWPPVWDSYCRVTNKHTFSNFKQHTYVFSQFLRIRGPVTSYLCPLLRATPSWNQGMHRPGL